MPVCLNIGTYVDAQGLGSPSLGSKGFPCDLRTAMVESPHPGDPSEVSEGLRSIMGCSGALCILGTSGRARLLWELRSKETE